VLPPGLLAKATVSLPLKPVAVFPSASSAVTVKPKPAPAVTDEDGCVVIESCVAVPGATEIALEVVELSPLLVTAKVYPLPTLLSVKPENVATPLAAETVTVPPSVLPPGSLDRATVSLPLKLVATLPWASSAVTVKPKPAPAVTLDGGCVVIESCVAVPGATEIAVEVAAVSPLLVTASAYPASALLSVKPENVTTPLVANTVTVPPSVLPPGLLAKATVSLPVKLVAVFPSASSAVTVKPKPAPALTLDGGCVVIESWVAVPGATEIAVEVVELSPLLVTAKA
jgi:hypothetical protein